MGAPDTTLDPSTVPYGLMDSSGNAQPAYSANDQLQQSMVPPTQAPPQQPAPAWNPNTEPMPQAPMQPGGPPQPQTQPAPGQRFLPRYGRGYGTLPPAYSPQTFGQSYTPLPNQAAMQYMNQQASHPFLRGLAGAAALGLVGAAYAKAGHQNMLPYALGGAAAGGALGFAQNAKQAQILRNTINSQYGLGQQSNQAFKNAQYSAASDIQNSLQQKFPNGIPSDAVRYLGELNPDSPNNDVYQTMNMQNLQDWAKGKQQLIEQMTKQMGQQQTPGVVGQFQGGMGVPQSAGAGPTQSPNPQTPALGAGQQPSETQPLQGGIQTAQPPTLSQQLGGETPLRMTPDEYTNAAKGGVEAGLMPSRIGFNQAHAEQASSQAHKNEAQLPFIAPEANAKISLMKGQLQEALSRAGLASTQSKSLQATTPSIIARNNAQAGYYSGRGQESSGTTLEQLAQAGHISTTDYQKLRAAGLAGKNGVKGLTFTMAYNPDIAQYGNMYIKTDTAGHPLKNPQTGKVMLATPGVDYDTMQFNADSGGLSVVGSPEALESGENPTAMEQPQ